MGKVTSGLPRASIRFSMDEATSTMALTVFLSLAAFSAWGDFMGRECSAVVGSRHAAPLLPGRALALERLAGLGRRARTGRARGYGGASPLAAGGDRGARSPPGGGAHHAPPSRPRGGERGGRAPGGGRAGPSP